MAPLRQCDEVAVEIDDDSIKITPTDPNSEFDITVTIEVDNQCLTAQKCHWDGQTWVCNNLGGGI